MSAEDIDSYLGSVPEPGRSTLEALRRSILGVVPDAEECLAYNAPAFRIQGKVVAGFAAAAKHLSYLPHSGTVLAGLATEVSDYTTTKGSLHFAHDTPLPDPLVRRLVEARMTEAGLLPGP